MKVFLRAWAVFLLMLVAVLTLARRENSGWIAFSANQDVFPVLYVMTGDGRSRHQISSTDRCAIHPNWSPDGHWLAYWDHCSVAFHFLRVQRGGHAMPSRVSDFPLTVDIAWSPQSDSVVVTHILDNTFRIIRLDDSGQHPLADTYFFPIWSADGDWIYALPRTYGRAGLDRIHSDSGIIEPVIAREVVITAMSLSPDGSRMLVVVPGELGSELFTVAADGGALALVSEDRMPRGIYNPAWSHNGQWIAFASAEQDNSLSLYVIRADGSGLQRLSQINGSINYLQWSPDGEWLLFEAGYQGVQMLFRQRADGSTLERITEGGYPQYAPVAGLRWHPLWLLIAAAGIIIVSMTRRFRS
jgi:Tol biopolymer transport system component